MNKAGSTSSAIDPIPSTSAAIVHLPSKSKKKNFTRKKKCKLVSQTVTIEENDDAAEVLQIQESEEHDVSSDVTGMTREQRRDHYEICMKLAAENKISAKNAFSLKLIDLLKHVLCLEDSSAVNFSAAGSVLDASSKIYSCRVDNLYSQVVRLANCMSTHQPPSASGGGPSGSVEVVEIARCAKRRNIIASKEQLKRIPLCKKLLPIDKMHGSCLMAMYPLMRPSEGIVLSKSHPFWPQSQTEQAPFETVTIWPHRYAPKNRPAMVRSELGHRNVREDVIIDDTSTHTSEPDVQNECSSLGSPEEVLVSDLDKSRTEGSGERGQFVAQEMLLPDDTVSDYCYLDTRRFPLVDTPDFWQYPTQFFDGHYKNIESASIISDCKKPIKEINYHKKSVNGIFSKKWKFSKSCEFKNWKYSDLVLFSKNEDQCKKMFKRLFRCQLVMKEPRPNVCHVPADDRSEASHSVDDSSADEAPISECDLISQDQRDQSLIEDEELSEASLLVGDKLVPAPPRRVVPQISYSLKPKIVDMRRLKDLFWTEIQSSMENIQASRDPVTFTALLRSVRTKVPTEEASELSWQLALATVLHVASEKNLHLFQSDITDFSIDHLSQ